MSSESRKILIVVAHPDDEILGCGGTIAKLNREDHKLYSLILGEGITSRDKKREIKKRKQEIRKLRNDAYKANKIIGIQKVYLHNFPDNRFDTVPLLDIVKIIESTINEIKPDIIFTHYEKDLNIDHRITYQAVLTATRPLSGALIKEIYSFEVLSSTEYNYPLRFSPNVFFDISDVLDKKIEAIKKYESEIKIFPHPRSTGGIILNASYRGMQIGVKYAEAFHLVRLIR